MTSSSARDLFPGAANVVYLNTASMALGAAPVRAAYEAALAAWTAGRFDFAEAERAGEAARQMFARLIGAMPREVAIVPSVSAAAGTIAAQFGSAKTGENVVVGAEEYTSNYFPWLQLRDLGYEVRAIAFRDGAPPIDAIAAQVDRRTRLLAVSAVQSSSGAAADLPALSEIVHREGGWLFVDASQASGAIPIDVRASGIDFLATPSHKFLCGTRGMGYLYVREELLPAIRPIAPGWKAAAEPLKSFYGPAMRLSETASKLDMSLTWFAAFGDQAAFGIFEQFGPDRIFETNRQLTRHLRLRLKEHGLDAAEPDAPVQSTIISMAVSDPDRVMRRLTEANVVASMRAGRIRISVHHYNSPAELDLVASLLSSSTDNGS
jgi:cysteine desulfurase/selenocysteine lyase